MRRAGVQSVMVLARHDDVAAGERTQPGDDIGQFALPVAADARQAEDFPRGDAQIDVAERGLAGDAAGRYVAQHQARVAQRNGGVCAGEQHIATHHHAR